MTETITSTELSRLLALSIYQIAEQSEMNQDCSTLLAETYIRLQEMLQPSCIINNNELKPDPEPALLSALGILAYQEYCKK